MIRVLTLVFLLLPAVALAQQRTDPVLQTAVGALQLLLQAYEQQGQRLTERDARIAELEKLCGDPCRK
jgi:hypothetical protein